MRVNRYLLLWALAAGFAVATGSAAIAAAGRSPDVLTASQVSAELAQARASAAPPSDDSSLGPDDWAGLLPSVSVVARCVGDRMQLIRWTGVGLHDIHAGPAATVSLALTARDVRLTFTGRCVDRLPTGSYRLNDEPAQDATFGKWVEMGFKAWKACPGTSAWAVPLTCGTAPVLALSPAPRHS